MRPWQASVVTGMGRVHRNFTRPTNRTVTSPQRRFTRTTRRSAACGMSTAIRAVRCLNLGGSDSSLRYRSHAPRYCRRTCWLACAGNCASHSHPGSGRERASRSCRSISWGDGRLATLPPLPPQPCHSWRRFQSARAACPVDPTSAPGREWDTAEPHEPDVECAGYRFPPRDVPSAAMLHPKHNRTHVRSSPILSQGHDDSNQ